MQRVVGVAAAGEKEVHGELEIRGHGGGLGRGRGGRGSRGNVDGRLVGTSSDGAVGGAAWSGVALGAGLAPAP